MAKVKKVANDVGVDSSEAGVCWLPAEKDYALALLEGKVVGRNPKGAKLASVPPWLKESEMALQLTNPRVPIEADESDSDRLRAHATSRPKA